MPIKEPEIVAAVDLGSNSFHMIVCSLKDGKLQTLDRLKEMVRLASGLDEKKHLDQKTQQRALACLERFGQRIHQFPPGSVRAVGTNTLRTAKNAKQFLNKAEAALGHPIHIISGIEEARMIYLGVAHSLESNANRRFVMDIGGGSTEYIIGTDDRPQQKESLYMGCVSLSNLFFKDGKISKKRFQNAVLFAERKLEPIQLSFSNQHWDEAIGASGTLRSVSKVLQATGWSNNGITMDGLQQLIMHMLRLRHVSELDLPELDPERYPVFPGGVAIAYATFESLGIQQMTVSEGALREGLIHDLLGRIYNRDIRSDSVRTLAEHYHVDHRQSARIKHTIRLMLNQLPSLFSADRDSAVQFLEWAADLHEIGHDIAHNQYHKHSAYIAENADLAGFSRQDQILLATIIQSHRRKFSLKRMAKLPSPWNKDSAYLTIILRLAVVLHRNRHDSELPEFNISIEAAKIQLSFPQNWLLDMPLINADLAKEADYLKTADFILEFQ